MRAWYAEALPVNLEQGRGLEVVRRVRVVLADGVERRDGGV